VAYVCTCNPITGEVEAGGLFSIKASLGYTVSSKLAWANQDPISRKNKQTNNNNKKNQIKPNQTKTKQKNSLKRIKLLPSNLTTSQKNVSEI
jgi:hypothetical protein